MRNNVMRVVFFSVLPSASSQRDRELRLTCRALIGSQRTLVKSQRMYIRASTRIYFKGVRYMMKTLIAALASFGSLVCMVSITAFADAPVTEKGKLIAAKRTDSIAMVSPLAAVFSGKPVTCVYKGPSGQTWEETYKPPCHGYSTHEVQPATPAAEPAPPAAAEPAK
jgi:hypothetical protein